ncbi:hypothetical protein OYC64_001061 [Pagothenia borchgrevinki]|uniref:Uncharacterized protein n=1 Tax=Pagothenia borchgrevinki TaxID=8213 RepID=A0ABD2HFK5_PAGBO
MSDLKEEKEDKSSVSSWLSLKRDRSKEEPPAFRNEPGLSDRKLRAASPDSGIQSMKSDQSKDFSDEPGPSDTKQRAESAVPSCLSLKSDRSEEEPPDFSYDEPGPSDTK